MFFPGLPFSQGTNIKLVCSFLRIGTSLINFVQVIPYTGLFPSSSRHLVLHAHVTSISSTHISLSRSFPQYALSNIIEYDYCIYALGSKLPEPIDVWSDLRSDEENRDRADLDGEVEGKPIEEERERPGTKKAGMQWLVRGQERIRHSQEILIVGGGALGIRTSRSLALSIPWTRSHLQSGVPRIRFGYQGCLSGEERYTSPFTLPLTTSFRLRHAF